VYLSFVATPQKAQAAPRGNAAASPAIISTRATGGIGSPERVTWETTDIAPV
jgi:hypothetical protein